MNADDPGDARTTAAAQPAATDVASIRPGGRIGRYALRRLLGQGAMASVWEAHDTQLGRDVAIKILSPAFSSSAELNERFRREARAVAALDHPGIVGVHDFVPQDGAQPGYLVEELIHGKTLGHLLTERQKVIPEIAIAVAAAVADALAAAHARGVVHRDVKPDNILLEPTVRSARVVLTDFGVAHVAGLESMTVTGGLVGSPAYMAPEQARGQPAGAPADQWALAVVVYQLTTGHLPFTGRDPFLVLAAIARGTCERPSRIQPRVGPELEAIILRALRIDPTARYQTMADMAAALGELLRSLGLGEGGDLLRRYLDDAGALEAEIAPRVAAHACARARQHIDKGEMARALAEIGRAQAYVRDHAGAGRLLASIAARRRWKRAAAIAAIVVAAGGAGVATWRLSTRAARDNPPAAKTTAAATATTATTAATTTTATTTATTPASSTATPAKSTATTPASTTTGVRDGIIASRSTPAAMANAATPAAAVRRPRQARPPGSTGGASSIAPKQPAPGAEPRAVAARDPNDEPAATTEAPAATSPSAAERAPTAALPSSPPAAALPSLAPPPPRTAIVRLSSRRGFCYPTLDDAPVGALAPEYPRVAAGAHKVFCAATPMSARRLVGTLDVPAGGTIERVVVLDPGTDMPAFSGARPTP